jgi:phosphatidylglycerol:prolipoprotein diacylglycerol transferase
MTLQTASIVHHPLSYRAGPLELTGFGLAVLLAFVIGQVIATRELQRRGHDAEPIGDLVFVGVIGSLLGAKIYYAILNGGIADLFSRAGFVFWGGLIGGILAAVLFIRYKKLPLMRIADVAGIALAAGYAVGRTGCWAVGDDYGRPWNSRWAVSFPEGAPPSTADVMSRVFGIPTPPGTPPNAVLSVYPTQLFEVAMALVMFAILWRLRDHKHAEGWLFGLYFVLAGIERFLVEFYRAKDDRFFGPFTSAQLMAVLFVAVGLVWMYARREVKAGAPGIYAREAA